MTVLTSGLQAQLTAHADDVMLVSLADGRQYTGQQVTALVEQMKQTLVEQAIGAGDVVLIALANHWLYPILEQALWEIGAIAHPVAPTSGVREILDEFADYHYTAGIFAEIFRPALATQPDFLDQTFAIHEQPVYFYRYQQGESFQDWMTLSDDSLAVILNTSGSTGKPKRVGLTHAQLANSAHHIATSQHLTNQDATMVVMPMFHVNAQVIAMLSTRLSGGKLVVAEKFSASKFWEAVADHQVTWVSIVPTIVQMLQQNERARTAFARRQADVQLKYVRSASFSLPAEQLAAFQDQYGIPVIEGYGMTEAASLIALNPFDAPKPGTVGLPVATEIALLVENQVTNAPNQTGEILLRGDHVITDYVDPKPSAFHDGWLQTGDLGRFDDDGYLKIVGRIKDIISRGGEKVAPAAIEATLRQLDFVADVVVVGTPDTLYGEAVAAVVIPTATDLTEAEMTTKLLEYASTQLSQPARPTQVFFVADYPRNPTGKVIRPQLAATIGK